MISRKARFAIVAGAVCLGALMSIGGIARNKLNRARLQQSRIRLFIYASASTDYFGMFKEWPRSLTELQSNAHNAVLVSPYSPPEDGWGNPLHYLPFSEARGYGLITSAGPRRAIIGHATQREISVRFTPAEVSEVP